MQEGQGNNQDKGFLQDRIEKKQEQKKRNDANNANTIKNAAEVADASGHPVASAIGKGVKLADKVTGGKSTELLGKGVSKSLKSVPGGKHLQKSNNKLAESGIGDKIGSAAKMANKKDVDAINNRAKNQATHSKSFRGNKPNSSSESKGGLGEKEGLGQGNNGLKNKDDKDKTKDSSSKGKSDGKSSGSGKGKSEGLGAIFGGKENPKLKMIKIKIVIFLIGIILALLFLAIIVSYISSAYDALLNSISTFFGIVETDPDRKNSETLLVDEKYSTNPKTGENYSTDELVQMLKEDKQCSMSSFYKIVDWFGSLDGKIDTFCGLVRHIQRTIDSLEKENPGLHMDRALILSSIFYSYAAQPSNFEYKDGKEPDNVVSADEHYESLMNMLNDGQLTKDDLNDIIYSALANHSYTHYTWIIEDTYDEDNVLVKSVGYCKANYVKDVRYSLLRWKMFLRFGQTVVNNYDFLSQKRSSWIATDSECNGTQDDSVLYAKVAARGALSSELDYKSINTAREDLKLGEPPSLELFEQKAEIEGYEKDIFQPYVSNYGTVEFDYKFGFAYKRFPYFEKAYISGLTNLSYDEAISPKIIENLISNAVEKKVTMNEILNFDDVDSPNAFTSFGSTWSSVKGAYCQDYVSSPFNNIQVTIKDCDGRVVGNTNFKDYIMGVAYGEVSNTHDDYVKTQMVAAISYALNRRNNYMSVPNISMKSGNCDQVYCSMTSGCYGTKSNTDCGGFACTSYLPGGGGYHGPADAGLAEKYSRLYDEASQFLLVKNGVVFGASYVSTVQNRWESLAKSGMAFTQILQETYSSQGAELVKCDSLDGDSGNSSDDSSFGNGPGNESVKRVGNLPNETYDRISPNFGKFYGYSYNENPEGRDISINPVWIDANITNISTPWNETYKVNKQAKVNFDIAYKYVNDLLTSGVKISDGNVCKYSKNDLLGGNTFEQRKTTSGFFSEASYGITQSWNNNMEITVNGKNYYPYSKGSSITDYNEFVEALGKEEDCRNINYILYKYAYSKAGFSWGRYDDTYDGSLFRVEY